MEITVNQYFADKAQFYDDVDFQPYWSFSDEILWFILSSVVLPKSKTEHFTLLDAGAGTARWSAKTLENYPKSEAHLVDISPDMLNVARKKMEEKEFGSRVKIEVGDVRQMNHVGNDSIEVLFCLHNVIGFFDDTLSAIKNFYKKLKPGGKCAVMFPSYYHAVYFSNANGRAEQLDQISKNRKVQYNEKMPPLKIFELFEIKYAQKSAGFKKVECYGFPLTVYPGMEETYLHGSSKHLNNLFAEPYRTKLMELEKNLCLQTELCARGNNILAVFEK